MSGAATGQPGGPVVGGIRRRPYLWGFLIGCAVVTAAAPLFRHVPDPPAVARTLPAWSARDTQGREISSRTLSGGVAVVALSASDCGAGCDRAVSGLAGLAARFQSAGARIEVVTFSLDDPRSCEAAGELFAADDASSGTGGPEGQGNATPCEQARRRAREGRLLILDALGRSRGTYASDAEGLDETFQRALAVLDRG